MKNVPFEDRRLPYATLAKYGLTQEMIEDLPMAVLDDINAGNRSPVLPVSITDDVGEAITTRTRFAFVRMDSGNVEVMFYPVLESSPLEKYSEAQQKQLLAGKAIIAEVEFADGRHSQALPSASIGCTRQSEQAPLHSLARDLSPEMRDLLLRNGMQAHVVDSGGGYQLVVQGHDSPLLTYNITERQMLALTDWGTNCANKKAYNVFTGIVAGDFYMPKNFVHARNANGRVAMGLHGYRVGIGEYGRTGRIGMPPPFIGWTPRSQEGFHLRRVGGRLFFPTTPFVPERWDGRMKPGELQSGGYGFYYKGPQTQQRQDVLQDLQAVITPVVNRPRSEEPAKPYKELITSPVYFSNEKWQECLASHGIIIDEQAKTLTVQSSKVSADMVYDLNEDELTALTSNSIKDYTIAKRLDVLNTVINDDFADKITLDMLNSKERIGIALHPEVEQDLQQRQEREQQLLAPLEREQERDEQVRIERGEEATVMDGRDLNVINENKGWYREGAHGREVEVGEIVVQPSENEGKYRMTAIIDGQAVSHEITQKEYDKFMAVDDYHRMKLFSKVFCEVDMKTRPEANAGLGTKIFAALTAGAVVTAGVAHDLSHHHHAPEFYGEPFGGPAPRPFRERLRRHGRLPAQPREIGLCLH